MDEPEVVWEFCIFFYLNIIPIKFQNNYSISDTDFNESEQYNHEIENEITGDTHTVTVPLTVCIAIMIGYVCLTH